MTSHTPQPPAGDDLVARLRNNTYGLAIISEAADFIEALTSQQHTEPVAGEVVAWQWSDFSGKWYTPDTARLPLHQQEELARMLAADHGGRVRPLYAALSGAEEK